MAEDCCQKRKLLIDERDVFYRPGTKRVLHPLTRSKDNPVIAPDRPWEELLGYSNVLVDPQTGKYRIWYQAHKGDRHPVVCYAESEDGFTWHKPKLGIYPFNGADTNIVLSGRRRYGVSVVDGPETEGSRRYKMAYWETRNEAEAMDPGLCVAFSPDGIHWTKCPENPVIRGSWGNKGEVPFTDDSFDNEERRCVPHSVGDVVDAFYDSILKRYVVYTKTWIDGPDGKMIWKRAIVRSESEDFVHWSRPELVMVPDEFDKWVGDEAEFRGVKRSTGVQLHGAPIFIYEGRYLAMVQKMVEGDAGGQPIELALSHDGRQWERPFREEMFLPLNDNPEAFDAGLIWSNATPIVKDEEIRFYYGAYRGTWASKGDSETKKPTGIGMATLPRDRFAGVQPLEREGQVTFHPLKLGDEGSVTVNANAADGEIRVEVLTEEGFRVRGFARENAEPITGDGLCLPVRWQDKRLQDLPPGGYRLRIYLTNDATLYAVNSGSC